MKKTLMIVLALVLVAGMAHGMTEKGKAEQGATPVVQLRADYTETEPNDDCGSANSPFVLGDSYTGSITPGDSDWYQYTAGAGNTVLFELAVPDGGNSMDTKMWLWAADCVTELAYNDDYNGLYSGFQFGPTDPGTYFIEVTGFSGTTEGDYVLMTSFVAPPPANDTCEGAIDLQDQGLSSFVVDLTTYTQVYNSEGCSGFSSAPGPDAVYSIELVAGETFIATQDGECDMSMYVVTDCADLAGSCVAGSDNCCSGEQEVVTFDAPADGTYYLIVDTYTGAGCEVTVTLDGPVAVEESNWGTIKSMFR